jgi:hypothetical protein
LSYALWECFSGSLNDVQAAFLLVSFEHRDLQIEKVIKHGKVGECIVAEAEEWGGSNSLGLSWAWRCRPTTIRQRQQIRE